MDHSDASGSSTFFLFLYLFFLMKDYGSIVIFPTFIVYFVSLVLSASPFSSKLVYFEHIIAQGPQLTPRRKKCVDPSQQKIQTVTKYKTFNLTLHKK